MVSATLQAPSVEAALPRRPALLFPGLPTAERRVRLEQAGESGDTDASVDGWAGLFERVVAPGRRRLVHCESIAETSISDGGACCTVPIAERVGKPGDRRIRDYVPAGDGTADLLADTTAAPYPI